MIVSGSFAPVHASSVGGALLAGLSALALTILPGWGATKWVLPEAGVLRTLAVAPAISAGMLYVTGEALSWFRFPVGAPLGIGALAVGLGLTVLDRRRSRDRLRTRTFRDVLLPTAVLIGSSLAAFIWWKGIGSLAAVPPNHDGYNHGYMTAQILRFGTLAPDVVLPPDPMSGHPAAHFYPLALHQQAAVVAKVAHVDVALAWTLCSLSCVAVALPVGVLLITRRVFPHMPLVAATSAIVAPLAPSLMSATATWGGYPMLAGLAVTPGVVELLLVAANRMQVSCLVLCSFAMAGVIGIHTSELVLVGLLAVVLLPRRTEDMFPLRAVLRHLAYLATAFAISLLLLLPILPQLAAGYEERSEAVHSRPLPLHEAMYALGNLLVAIPPMNPWPMVLAFWVGLVATVVVRPARPWLLAWLGFVILYLWLAVAPNPVVRLLTAPWYSDFRRLAYVLVLLELPIVAYALARPVERFRSRTLLEWSRASSPVVPVVAAAAAGLGLLLAVEGEHTSIATIHQSYRSFSLLGPDERSAFDYLSHHLSPGERVANQPQDDSPWMYSLYGVSPLVAWNGGSDTGAIAERTYLLSHLADVKPNPRLDALVARLHIAYVYVGPKVFQDVKANLTSDLLERSPRVREVFRSNQARVFAILPTGGT